jgi:cation transport ATPase
LMTVSVAIGGKTAGVIVLQDTIRSDAKTVLSALRKAGIARIVLASGDRAEIARSVGEELGVDEILGDLSAESKVAAVRREAAAGPVIMVGDGVNDAPALAAADVGVAMGARGTAASSEAAGVVLLVDQLEPLAKAIVIAKRTRNIALQSVVVGLGLSIAAMVVAAFGTYPRFRALFCKKRSTSRLSSTPCGLCDNITGGWTSCCGLLATKHFCCLRGRERDAIGANCAHPRPVAASAVGVQPTENIARLRPRSRCSAIQ